MGSVTGSVADDYGVRVPPANAPQPFWSPNAVWIITSLYTPATYPSNWTTNGGTLYVPFEYGWRNVTFQLTKPKGTGSGAVNLFGTTDQSQAIAAGTAWENLPVTFGNNQLGLGAAAQHIAYADMGQWVAFRMLANATIGTGSASYCLMGMSS